MALQIIDRRLAGKNKSVGNRERFVRRYKEQIADAVRRAVSERDIRNIGLHNIYSNDLDKRQGY